MSGYSAPWEQDWAAKQALLQQRVGTLERQIAQLTSGQVAVTSTTHPPNPWAGMQIYEINTGLTAYWNGALWVYPPQLVDSITLGSPQTSVTFPSGSRPIPNVFTVLRLEWRIHLSSGGATDLLMQVDGDTTAHYLWGKVEEASGAAGNGHGGSAQTFMKVGAVGGSTGNYFASGSMSIAGWADTAGHLSVSGTSALFDTNSVDFVGTYGALYAMTAPHSSLKLFPPGGSMIADSRFSLYGWT